MLQQFFFHQVHSLGTFLSGPSNAKQVSIGYNQTSSSATKMKPLAINSITMTSSSSSKHQDNSELPPKMMTTTNNNTSNPPSTSGSSGGKLSSLPPLKKKSVTVKETIPPPVPPRGSSPRVSARNSKNVRVNLETQAQHLSTGSTFLGFLYFQYVFCWGFLFELFK